MALHGFLKAIAPDTMRARKKQIETQLLAYCGLDTYAMVRLWAFFYRGSIFVDADPLAHAVAGRRQAMVRQPAMSHPQ